MKKILILLALVFIIAGGYFLLNNNAETLNNIGEVSKTSPVPTIKKSGIYLALSEVNKSGETGLALIIEKNNSVYVDIKLVMPAFTEDTAGLYLGTCQKIGPVKFALSNVINGSSTTNLNINMDKINQLLPMVLVINRTEGSSKVVAACGQLKK